MGRPPRRLFHPKLWCHVRGFEPNLVTHVTVIRVILGDCTDMRGAIDTCRKLDPDVREIRVIGEPGSVLDTIYRRVENGEWTAQMYRHDYTI